MHEDLSIVVWKKIKGWRPPASAIVMAVVIFCSYIYVEYLKVDYRINIKANDYTIGVAKATDYGGRPPKSLSFEFTYKDEEYRGINRPQIYNGENFLNRFFPVVISVDDPDENAVLVTPDDFAFFDIPFPDSLKWVTNHTYKDYPGTRKFKDVNP